MSRNRFVRAAANILPQLLALVLTASIPVRSQSATADLEGFIGDSRGGALAGAQVRLEDVDKGWMRTATVDERGNYRLTLLRPGRYRLQVEHPGFERKTVEGLSLSVGEKAQLDVTLEVSPLQEEVVVAADASIVERGRSDPSSTIDSLEIEALPSDGRSYLDFALLTPGVSDRSTLATERPVQAPTSGISFAGQDQRSAQIYVDGVDNLDDISNSARGAISQEAVQEFQISRSSYPAALGGARGGVVNIVSKSGANEAHGSLFFYLRDESLDARNTFAKRQSSAADPRFDRRQFGASWGGALAPDQTFFFAAYEGRQLEESRFVTFLDDSSIFDPTASQLELFDFLGSTGDPGLQTLAAAFVNPQSGILRTLPSTFPETLLLLERESGTFPFQEDLHTFSLRIDHRFTESNQAFWRFNFTDHENDNTDFGALEGVSNGVQFDIQDWAAVFGDLHVFSPNTLNDFKFQYARRQLQVLTNDPFGPEVRIAGIAELGREFLNPTRYDADLFEFLDHVTWIRGNHAFRAGVEVESRLRRGDAEVFLGGQFAFGEAIPLAAVLDSLLGPGSAAMLGALLATPPENGGLGRPDLAPNLEAPLTSLQSFNFGLPITYFQGFGDPSTDVPITRFSAFFQDDWRIGTNLNLNLGLRYDTSWRTETLNLLPGGPPFSFDRGAVNDHDNIAPRLGFAWSPRGDSFTVRGGYGIYYQNVYGALEVTSSVLSGQISQVFLPITGLPGTEANSAAIWNFIRQTGAGGEEALSQFGIIPGSTPSIILPGDPTMENPYSHHASLAVEQALGLDWAVELGYLMNSGVHLIRSRDHNVRPVGPNQFGFPGLDPTFIQVPVVETGANSIYHGLTASLRKRFSSRYGLNLAYTLGKAIDDTTDFIIELGPQDHTNLGAERGLSTFDQRHRLAVSAVVEGPAGGWSSRGWLDALLRDWTSAAIVVWGSGKPFNLLNGFDRNGDTHEETDRPLTNEGDSVGRNTGRGPQFFSADLRLARRFPLAWRESNLEFTCDIFNLFNNVNYFQVNNVVGDRVLTTGDVQGSPRIPSNQPLGFTSAFDPRRIQLGLRFLF